MEKSAYYGEDSEKSTIKNIVPAWSHSQRNAIMIDCNETDINSRDTSSTFLAVERPRNVLDLLIYLTQEADISNWVSELAAESVDIARLGPCIELIPAMFAHMKQVISII